MSTYINTNTTASMAALNLSMNNAHESTDIEQLSTGLRINSAADDPAGLVVSEDNQAQLAGLTQATANSNDAINETQTAESALNQVQNLLISMRALAVQASNSGVNDSTDVQADQTQIASAIQSINRISSTTQFGNKFLLDGSATSALTTTPGSGTASSGAAFSVVASGAWSANNAYDYTQNTLSATSDATSTFATGQFAGGTPAAITSSATFAGSIDINGTTYNLTSTSPTSLAGLNTSIAASGYTASVTGGNLVFTANTVGPVNAPTINASSLLISGQTSSIGANADAAHVTTFATAAGTGGSLPHSLASVSAATAISVNGTLDLQSASGASFSKTYAAGTTINQVQQDLNATFGVGADAVTVSTSATGQLLFTDASNNLTSTGTSGFSAYNTVTPPATSTFVNGATSNLTLSDGTHTLTSTSTQTIGGVSYYSFGNGLVLSSSVAPVTTGTTAVNGALQGTAGSTTIGTNLEYQLGANGGQTASLSIGSYAAAQLGQGAASYTDANGTLEQVLTGSVADLNVTTFKGAQDAMSVIDQAIDQVSTERANLGAFQTNVLQSNVTSLGVATTNLQSSESTVADADMASTVVNYTKDQILVSASTSALSYANQMPQEILKLLQ